MDSAFWESPETMVLAEVLQAGECISGIHMYYHEVVSIPFMK